MNAGTGKQNASPMFVISTGAVLSLVGITTAVLILCLLFNLWMYRSWRSKRSTQHIEVDDTFELEVATMEKVAGSTTEFELEALPMI